METSLLEHPAIQSGVAPFLCALLISGIFYRFSTLAGLSIVAGFIVSAFLSTGFSFDPLTSTRKITLLILVAPVLGILLAISEKYSRLLLNAFYVFGALAMLWVMWPVLSRDPVDMIMPVIGYMVYAAWMVGLFMRLSETTALSAGAASTAVGFGVGITALIGASALLGQMGLSLGAAGAAYLLVQLLSKQDMDAGFTITLTSGFMAALILPAAVVYAKVPWIVIPLIAIVPLFAFYPFEDEQSIWKNTISLLIVMALPIGYAIYLTVQSAGEMIM